MSQEKRDHKIMIYGEDAHKKLLGGAKEAYRAVTTTYGPKGRNVLIEKVYGRPTLTRDGVSVAKEVYSKDRAFNMAMQLVLEASSATNRVAGDGTTATVALTYNLMKEGFKRVAAGEDPMHLRESINKDATILLNALESQSKEVSKGQLEQVATVSSGDALLGKMIAEAVEKVGENGGIITEKSHVSGVEREYVDGYYLQNGFTAISEGRREIENALVVVSSKRLSSHVDALEILQKVSEANKGQRLRIAFIGEIEGDAYKTIVTNIMQGNVDAVIVATPSTGDMGVQYLEDIALYTGARLLSDGDNIQNFDASWVGQAKRIVCTQTATSIFSESAIEEDLKNRIEKLQKRVKLEESEFLAEKIKDRIAKLEGKIALFKIGGATETEKDEKEYRIEDAIQATRAAYGNGVVPGGGTTLLRLGELEISPLFKEAIHSSFRKLMENASLPADVKINDVLGSKSPMGINIRNSGKLVDLVKEGVLDPTRVVEQIITNASSIAGNAITTDCMIVFEDREAK